MATLHHARWVVRVIRPIVPIQSGLSGPRSIHGARTTFSGASRANVLIWPIGKTKDPAAAEPGGVL